MKLLRFIVMAAIVCSSGSGAIARQSASPGAVVAPPQPPAPQRTPARGARPGEELQKGTSVVRGFVLSAETGAPLRRALVNVRSSDGRGGGMATTDAQGQFEIKELPAGRYNISALKAGFVTTSYGQRRPEQPGTPLELRDGQLADKIIVSLPRGGVISGKVLDEFGDPIAGAQVNALRFRFMNNGRRLAPSGNGQTDDLGNYRIYGLAPGEYYVSAGLRMQGMLGMNMGPPGTGGFSNVEGYAPTYFPGTPNAGEAQRIVVRTGRDATDISFALTPTRLVTVSGRAISSSGEPYVQAFIMAMPADRFGATMGMGTLNGMTRPDGSFQLTGVAPGTYNLSLRPNDMSGRRGDATTEFANLRITVWEDDLTNVLLVTSRGAIARGVIVSDDGSELPIKAPQVMISAMAVEPEMAPMPSAQPKVNEDLTFELVGLSDSRLIRAFLNGPQDWALKAVYNHGQDVTDTPIDFTPGREYDGIEIVFTRKRTELSGSVTDDRGEIDTDATVLVFSADRERWTPMTRFVRTARPAQDGRYNLRGMPPHDYLAVAVRSVEMGQWQDPDFLESVRDQAVRVSLNEGETKVQDLKIARQ
jgi:hypothetical protein